MAALKDALTAYLHLIERLGATPDVVAARRELLQKLLDGLAGKRRDVDSYHAGVDVFLAGCPLQEKLLAVTCAREFFYFWLDDMKKVMEITSGAGFTVRNLDMPLQGSLDALLQLMRRTGFQRYPPSLGLYLGKLFEDGMAEDEIRRRETLLQALLFLLDSHPFHASSYRMAVDALLLHLDSQQDGEYLRQLVREYFPHWQSFPFASQRLGASGKIA
ncbi:hypothetical protein C2134_13995 [Chromobacterium sinusclupearum]|uniref:Uncharacterized protein n=2 Tax=Pseudomonadota TaxID=1224 RepID=A0A2K4ML19_9NEIS|nr:hypothetical protein [Chromobacterium sinusclupearum]POA97773.1 hypothetical protein C2134_13995 [Chromobacterium sinusclupearum]